MHKMWQQAIHVHGWMIGVNYISTKMEDHSLFWLLNYVVTKIWWSTNRWNQNLTLGEHLVTKICNPIMPWSKLDSQLVWPNCHYFSNWQSKLVIKLCCCQNLVTSWKETMLCDFAIKYYLTTEVCAIEIMSPTCVSDSTIMLSIPRVQTLMSIVVNWPWGLKFASQLLQLEFS
jgi:hypothetical protein